MPAKQNLLDRVDSRGTSFPCHTAAGDPTKRLMVFGRKDSTGSTILRPCEDLGPCGDRGGAAPHYRFSFNLSLRREWRYYLAVAALAHRWEQVPPRSVPQERVPAHLQVARRRSAPLWRSG